MDCTLAECDWSQILADNDVNDMVNELADTLTQAPVVLYR